MSGSDWSVGGASVAIILFLLVKRSVAAFGAQRGRHQTATGQGQLRGVDERQAGVVNDAVVAHQRDARLAQFSISSGAAAGSAPVAAAAEQRHVGHHAGQHLLAPVDRVGRNVVEPHPATAPSF